MPEANQQNHILTLRKREECVKHGGEEGCRLIRKCVLGTSFFYIRHTLTKFELNLQSERYQTGTNYSTWEGLGTNTGVKEKKMEQERSNQPSKTSLHN